MIYLLYACLEDRQLWVSKLGIAFNMFIKKGHIIGHELQLFICFERWFMSCPWGWSRISVPWTVICPFLCVVLRADQGSVGCWQTVYLSPWVVLRAGPRSVCCMWPGHISFWNNIRVWAEKDWLKRVSMLGSSYNVPFIWSPWGWYKWPVYWVFSRREGLMRHLSTS